MAAITWKWNRPYGSERFVEGALPLIDAAAQDIAESCGEGYEAVPAQPGVTSNARAAVLTTTYQAMRAEAKHHNLTRYT